MFIIRTSPDISDEFLMTYRLSEILSMNTSVSLAHVSSDKALPSFDKDVLSVFRYDIDPHSPSIWCGLPKNFVTTSEVNIGYITEWRENLNVFTIMNFIDKHWIIGPDFPYPHLKEPIDENRCGIFMYCIPTHQNDIWNTIEGWYISDCNEPLKIFAPYQSPVPYKEKIKELKLKYNKNKEIFITTPNLFSPKEINQEIAKSKYIADIRKHKSISYSTLIGLSYGIPTLGSDFTFPEPLLHVKNESIEICKDGSRLTGEKVANFSIIDISNGFDSLSNDMATVSFDNSSHIIEIFREI